MKKGALQDLQLGTKLQWNFTIILHKNQLSTLTTQIYHNNSYLLLANPSNNFYIKYFL